MKRIITVILTLTLVLTLTACKGDMTIIQPEQRSISDNNNEMSQVEEPKENASVNTCEEAPDVYSTFKDIPDDIYEFAITYMMAREISNVEARQYVRYFGENAEFMMEAWGNNLTWLEEWNIDRFEKVNNNLYVFFVYWKVGHDYDEDYTGPRREESGYIPYFVCLMDEELFIVHALQFLPQGYGDGLDSMNYQAVHYGVDEDDIVSLDDVVAFQEQDE